MTMSRFLKRYIVFVVIISLGFGHLISSSSEADHDEDVKKKKHVSEAVVVGKVYCDTCFQQTSDITANFITGASVAVECEYKGNPVRKRARTNRRGEFRVRLPLTLIQSCSVKLIHTTHPYCAVATSASSSNVCLRSSRRRHGTPVFSAGLFTFRPLVQPSLCNQKPIAAAGLFSFPPLLEDPADPGDLPPLPHLPVPDIPLPELPLPPLPHLPRLPNLPPLITARRTTEIDQNIGTKEFFFPPNPLQPPLIQNPFQPPLIPNPLQPPPPLLPNPFQPPPAPFIPNPFQPPPAAPGLPNPFQPPPAAPNPLLPIPPLPGLTPSPPPPPPAFGLPFPPFPFRPPGVPVTPPRRKP